MSSAFDCCLPCPPGSMPSASTVNIPGPQGDPGEPGAPGADGTNGENAFTVTLADVLLPVSGNNVSVSSEDVSWMQIGQNVFMSGTEGVANFQVISRNTTTNFAVLKFLSYNGDLASGLTISAGAGISPSGIQSVLPPEALFVTAFESDEYAIAAGIIVNIPHGLNGVPEIVQAKLVSQDGSEGGYSAGDEVGADAASQTHATDIIYDDGQLFAYGADNVNAWASYGINSPSNQSTLMPEKSGGACFAPTLTDDTKWKIKIVAVKLNTP